MAKLDLSSLMETVSNLDTSAAAPELRMIRLEDIQVNKDNFYRLSDLGPLADSIAMEGLQQPLVVTPHPGKEGKYQLISGHRRRAAIESLVKDKDHPREDLRLIPCMVKTYSSPALAELQLILANSTARELTNAEKMKQAEKMEMLLYQLKEEGYEFPGRMRDQVAAACKVSAPKLARLKVIREKLIPDFMHLFENEKLPEQTAYALARLPAEFQGRISKTMGIDGLRGAAVERVLERYNNGWRWEPDQTCPDGKACKRGDAFLRHDLEHTYEMCGGNKCCLKCQRALDSYCACDRMCSKAQAQREERKDADKAKSEAAAQKRAKENQAKTQANAKRLLRAIDAAGLPDESRIDWHKYWNSFTAGDVRRWAAGDFIEAEGSWSQEKLKTSDMDDPAGIAQLLGCSSDFLLGLTDELRPSVITEEPTEPQQESTEEPAIPPPEPAPAGFDLSVWDSLTPPVEGWVPLEWIRRLAPPPRPEQLAAVKIVAEGMELPILIIARWDKFSKAWRYPNTGVEVGGRCDGWFPLPDDKEETNDN